MVPIPDYLKDISIYETSKDNNTFFSIQCTCGCSEFYILENKLTAEEKNQLQPYYDVLTSLYCSGGYGVTGHWIDDERAEHTWKLLSPDRENGPKEDVIFPPRPVFAGISRIECKCASCNREFLLYDSRMHGYDGVTADKSAEELQYQPVMKQKTKESVAVQIMVENDESLEEFRENTDPQYDQQQYSNAFSWFVIYAVKNGRKRKLFDIETA